jgi:hypothetical protein
VRSTNFCHRIQRKRSHVASALACVGDGIPLRIWPVFAPTHESVSGFRLATGHEKTAACWRSQAKAYATTLRVAFTLSEKASR